MKIIDAICTKGLSGFFYDDQQAIKNGALPDGASYTGNPVTSGFTSIRQPGESVSILLVLENGYIGQGDCVAVQYSGTGGRDKLFLADTYIPIIKQLVFPQLINKELSSFKELAEIIDNMINPDTGKKIHTAIRYGVTQAILHAVAISHKTLMANIMANEYKTTVSEKGIPIFSQSGDMRYKNVDKMIIKKASCLPHGLINNLPNKLGYKGEKFIEYISWVTKRINTIGDINYCPTLHFDVYGTIGLLFDNNFNKMLDYFEILKKSAGKFHLRIEGPIDTNELESQVSALATLTVMVNNRIEGFEIVADEWCNTLDDIKYFADNQAGHMLQIKTPDLGGINNIMEAILYCKGKNIGAYQGGTCNETDISSKACVHVAMAGNPDLLLAKPGMGVDEGLMLVINEMQRIIAVNRRIK